MDLKTLKRNMAQVFSVIKTAAEEGEIPSESDIGQFVRLTRQFHLQAEDAWAGEAEDFAHLVNQLQQAVKHRHREEVVILVEQLSDAENYCHRTFKK